MAAPGGTAPLRLWVVTITRRRLPPADRGVDGVSHSGSEEEDAAGRVTPVDKMELARMSYACQGKISYNREC
jgi:hypothetical protein